MKYIKNFIPLGLSQAFKYNIAGRFINVLCTIRYCNEFSNSFQYIYPKEPELKIEHEGTHVKRFNPGITI